MKQADFESRMADYLEGDLPLEDRALYDAYLDANPASATEIAELRTTISLLRSLPDPEPPPDLASRVLREIRAQEARGSWWQRLTASVAAWTSPQWAVPLTAAAALVVLAVLSGDLEPPGSIGDPEPTASRPVARTPQTDRSRIVEGGESPPPPAPAPTPRAVARAAAEEQAPSVGRSEAEARADTDPGRSAGEPSATHRVAQAPTPAHLLPVANVPMQVGSLELLEGPPGPEAGTFVRPASGPLGSRAVTDEPGSEAQRNARLDAMLAALREDPEAVVRFIARESETGRELWGTNLAQRANELGVVDPTREALEADPRLAGGPLALAFGSEIDRLQREVIAKDAEAVPAAEATPDR